MGTEVDEATKSRKEDGVKRRGGDTPQRMFMARSETLRHGPVSCKLPAGLAPFGGKTGVRMTAAA